MRALVITGALAALLAAGCGGPATLSGTFTDNMYVSPGHSSCAAQESAHDPGTWKVRVAVDGVTVGTVPVQWQGGNDGQGACRATWSTSVPAAQKAYRVTLIAVCGALSDNPGTESIASVIVQPSAAGQPVRLSDETAGGSDC